MAECKPLGEEVDNEDAIVLTIEAHIRTPGVAQSVDSLRQYLR